MSFPVEVAVSGRDPSRCRSERMDGSKMNWNSRGDRHRRSMVKIGVALMVGAATLGMAKADLKDEGVTSTHQGPEDIVLTAIEAYNHHDLDAFLKHHSEEMVTVAPVARRPIRGLEALKDTLPNEWKAFPDAHFEVKRILGRSGLVAAEVIWIGSYGTSLPGLPRARGQKIRLPQIGMYTVKDGLITSLRSYYDPEELASQMEGHIPVTPVAALQRLRGRASHAYVGRIPWNRRPARMRRRHLVVPPHRVVALHPPFRARRRAGQRLLPRPGRPLVRSHRPVGRRMAHRAVRRT